MPAGLAGRGARTVLGHGHIADFRQDEVRTPDGSHHEARVPPAPRRGRGDRARRRGAGRPGPAVPAPGPAPAGRAARRPARRRRARTTWPPSSASWPRRSTWPRGSGTCWSTSSPPPASSGESIRVYLARDLRGRRRPRRLRPRGRGGRHGRRLGAADRPRRRRPGGRLHNPSLVSGVLAAGGRPGPRLVARCGPPTRPGRPASTCSPLSAADGAPAPPAVRPPAGGSGSLCSGRDDAATRAHPRSARHPCW